MATDSNSTRNPNVNAIADFCEIIAKAVRSFTVMPDEVFISWKREERDLFADFTFTLPGKELKFHIPMSVTEEFLTDSAIDAVPFIALNVNGTIKEASKPK